MIDGTKGMGSNDNVSFDPLSDEALAALGAMVERERDRRAKVVAIFEAHDQASLGGVDK